MATQEGPLPGEAAEQILIDARQSLGAATLDDLFPEGEQFRRSVATFIVLLALAALIATFGLLEDSVAAIIGAMVVAPLGGAMMALAGALVTGRSRWQLNAFLQTVLGALLVVAIGYAVSLLIPDPLLLNPSLEARTSPGLLDLGVALAAGAAGAYVAVRRTGSDALPGVAIAVSLVPPLATVGICAERGLYEDAAGALILFLTNFAAIVVIACIVFVLCGARPPDRPGAQRRLMVGFVIATIGLVTISIPLVINATLRIRDIVWSNAGAPVVVEWIGDRDLRVDAWSIDGGVVTISLAGPDKPGDASVLAKGLADAIGQPIELSLDYVYVEHEAATAAP